jgi:EAL domain-containing protein (putative c-di-GMP-specific phosphodiesterase class I)
VAEGVEPAVAARHLTELGCDAMQGFHLARPLLPRELGAWLRDLRSNAGGCEDHRPLADAVTTKL